MEFHKFLPGKDLIHSFSPQTRPRAHVNSLSEQHLQLSCLLPPDHQLCNTFDIWLVLACQDFPVLALKVLSVSSGHSALPGVSGWLATPVSHLLSVSLLHSYILSSKSCWRKGERSHQTLVAYSQSWPLIAAQQLLLQNLGQLLSHLCLTAPTFSAFLYLNTTHWCHFLSVDLATYQDQVPTIFHFPTMGPAPSVPHLARAIHSLCALLSPWAPTTTLSSTSVCLQLVTCSSLSHLKKKEINWKKKKKTLYLGSWGQPPFHFISLHVKLEPHEERVCTQSFNSYNFKSLLNMPLPASSLLLYLLHKDTQ